MKHLLRSLFFALAALLFVQSLSAQSLSLPGDGKDFWVGYMFPSYNKAANPGTEGFYGAYLLISSYTQNRITVSYFDRVTGVETPGTIFTLSARTGQQIQLSLDHVKMGDTGDRPEYAACHVTAQRAINVEFFSTGACSGGSFLPITSAGLGTKYVIASYGNNPGDNGVIGASIYPPKYIENSYGFFEIVAPFDNTLVTITPNSTTQGGHPGYRSGANHTYPQKVPYTVALSRGQCYLVKSAGDDPDDDISGSLVESNKPVAVIAGHENATIGAGTDAVVQGISRTLEARDFMVEQMYPLEMWDTVDYVMVPLRDSQPADPAAHEGVGEMYRVFSYDQGAVNVNYWDACRGFTPFTTTQLAQPAVETPEGVTCPTDFEGANGHKFSVMMYDLRNFANAAPYPAPSMVTVIPMSRWRKSFLWYVPANKFEILQGYYVDVIAQDADFNSNGGIMASFNGGTLKPLKALLSLQQQWKGTIPNHPSLTGMQFKLSPGSYYATGPHPFMVYNFGFRALDPNYDLGDFDGDDFFFSYGLPVGIRLGGTPHISVKVDTFCDHWNVCVHDSSLGLTNQGIKSISLMDDPTGDEFDVHPGRVFYNTRLDDSLDPDHKGEINLAGDDSDFCFKVEINNIADTGYAPLFIVDDQGGAIMVELHSKSPIVKLNEPDSGRYFNMQVHQDSSEIFIFKNTAKFDPKNPQGNPFRVTSATLKNASDTMFKITSIVPPIPRTLYAGDSIIFTVSFTPQDTLTRIDTLVIGTDCQVIPIPLIGNAGIPIIVASDHDFGAVLVDSTKCDTVGVRNIGKFPFTLTKNWLMANYGVNFTFPDSIKLPVIIPPKGYVLFTFCYTPHSEGLDSVTQNWGTTLQDPYKHSNKDFSKLYGHGVKTGFVWDREVQSQTVTCEDSITTRVYLYNNALPGSPLAHVDRVFLRGPDLAEFHIIANSRGYAINSNTNEFGPSSGFDLSTSPNSQPDSVLWVDVQFKPILAKPMPVKYADRLVDLVASGPSQKDQVINFTGTVLHADPIVSPPSLDFGQVTLGVGNILSFLIQDIGTADLIIQSIGGVSYPVNNIDSIVPGSIVTHDSITAVGSGTRVYVHMILTDYTDTTVYLILTYKTGCAGADTIPLHIMASFVNPTNTGHNYDSVFECRSSFDSIVAQNLGTRPLTLRQIEIVKERPFAGEFTFSNGLQVLPVGVEFPKNTRTHYPVHFTPITTGWDTAIVQCIWDSLDITTRKVLRTDTSTNILIGYGRREHQTFVPLQSAIPKLNVNGIMAQTGTTFKVPIQMVDTLPGDVYANGVTFSVTYHRDLLDYLTPDLPANFQPEVPLPTVGTYNNDGKSDGTYGTETMTFSLRSTTGPISVTTPIPLIYMKYRIMVSEDTVTDITVSNAVFWGNDPTDTLCYIDRAYKVATFSSDDSCGDPTLRNNGLRGLPISLRIVSITPNPVAGSDNPVLTYEVKQKDLPITIELYNALGQKIRTIAKDVPQDLGEHTMPLGTKNLTNGLYVIRLTTAGHSESGEFVIQK